MVKLVWPDGRIDEIEHAFVEPTIGIIEVKCGYTKAEQRTIANFSASTLHRFRRMQVGNVETAAIHTLWVHLDTDVHVVKRVVDEVAAEKPS